MRPATLDDAALAADLMTASYPVYAQDPVVTRYRWKRSRRGWSLEPDAAGSGRGEGAARDDAEPLVDRPEPEP